MTPPAQEPKEKQASDPDLIVTPISIARARHASMHQTASLDVEKSGQRATPPPPKKQEPIATDLHGLNCLVIFLLGVAFLAGGVLGGIVGGELMLWAHNRQQTAFWQQTPTPSPSPSPTPIPAATVTPTPTPAPIPTPAIEDVIAEVIPAVVTVINKQPTNGFNLPNEGRVVGSGVIVNNRGYIVTNHHVVENAGELRVILSDGREVIAQLVASDPNEDLAIIKIGITELPTIRWGDSAQVRLGQMVYAIGSPLGDFPSSVSFGIVSGMNRALEMDAHIIDGLIQTDAAINRGSSGGPLINIQGEVVGINTFFIRESEERGVAEGIAFAIPANTVQTMINPWIAAYSGETIPASEEPGD